LFSTWVLLAGSEVDFAGFPCLEDLDEDAGIEVMILGVATSERATQIGNFSAARARVELSAVRVSDSIILGSTSGYGVGTDISNFVAEKKAIESATEKIQSGFIEKIINNYNAKSK
jgi:hypothetical protein